MREGGGLREERRRALAPPPLRWEGRGRGTREMGRRAGHRGRGEGEGEEEVVGGTRQTWRRKVGALLCGGLRPPCPP